MKGKNLTIQFPYKIISLKTNSFSEISLSDEEIDDFNPDAIEFGIKPSFGFNDELRAVKVNYIITYTYNSKELLKIDVDTVFEYADIEGFDSKSKAFLASILGISFSTIRGIILNRTIGSFLNNIYLPIINPTEIIDDQVKN
ncbi:MAG: hypothetical protein JEZ08_25350 [Clostridiales bacterium]|nr:hypothetical protein [Clostridiales bacterium]